MNPMIKALSTHIGDFTDEELTAAFVLIGASFIYKYGYKDTKKGLPQLLKICRDEADLWHQQAKDLEDNTEEA